MANSLTEILTLKLLLDDQEAIKNLKLTNEEVNKLKKAVDGIDDEFIESFERIRGGLQGINPPLNNQVVPGTQKLNLAMNQLGYVVNDASAFLVNFRMGMMGIANNIPMVINLFQSARQEIAATGSTIRSALVSSLMGPGGVLLAVNAVMFAMQFLPDILDSITDSTDSLNRAMSDEEKQLRTKKIEYNSLLGVLQDVNQEETARKEALKQLTENYPEYITLQEKDLNNNDKIAKALEHGNEQFEKRIKLAATETILKEYYEEVATAEYEILKLQEERQRIQKQFDEGNKARGFSLAAIDKDLTELEIKKTEATRKVQEFNAVFLELQSQIDDKKDPSKETVFKQREKELSEEQRHSEALLKIRNNNDYLSLVMRIKHFDQMIGLYKKFGQDTTQLEHQRAEAELQLWIKASSEKERLLEINLKRTFELNERKSNEISELENRHKLETIRLNELTTENELNLMDQKKEAIAQGMGEIASVFAHHTVAYQALAKAQALIDTYTSAEAAYKSLVGIPFVGPALAVAAAAAAIATGLAHVEQIGKVKIPGYAEGGRLPQGKAGYVEGWHDEIIAPEKTFVEVFRNELRPQIYNGGGMDSNSIIDLKKANDEMRNLLIDLRDNGIRARAYLNDDEARKVTSRGNFLNRKSRL